MQIKIRDWDKNFERDRTRQWKRLEWVPIPNKQGIGYRKIMKQANGLEIYACWIALVSIASTCTPRGDLSKYTIEDLADLSLINGKKLLTAIIFLSQTLDWIQVIKETPKNLDKSVKNLDLDVPQQPNGSSILFSSNTVQFSSNTVQDSSDKVTNNQPENIDKQIEVIYTAYPKKKGKGAADRAIRSALKKLPFDDLLQAVQKFAEAEKGKDPKYIPYPATWFNQERWLDENDPPALPSLSKIRERFGRQEITKDDIEHRLNMELPE